MKYYFLVTYLPEIHRDDKKIKLRFGDLLNEKDNIDPADWQQIELLLLSRDIFLLERLLSGKDAEVEHTLYAKEYWKDQVKAPKEAPPYLEEFLLAVKEKGFGPRAADSLYEIYYEHVLEKTTSSLLNDYLLFEKNLRNILAAIRARKQGLPPADHVLGGGELVEQLGRSSADDFGLGQDMPWIDRLLEAKDPLQLEETVEEILWEYIEERIRQNHFEFDVVLAYLLRLQLLEKRLALSEERGMEIVRQLEEL